jgi:hypothetical protein
MHVESLPLTRSRDFIASWGHKDRKEVGVDDPAELALDECFLFEAVFS